MNRRAAAPTLFRRVLPALLFLSALCCGAARGEATDESLAARLKTEAAASLRARRNAPDALHLKWFVSAEDGARQYELFSQGENGLIRSERVPNGGDEDASPQAACRVATAACAFELSRGAESAPWKLESYKKFRGGAPRDDAAARAIRELSPYYVGDLPLAEFLESENLHIARAESKTDRGVETIAVDFDVPASEIFEGAADGTVAGRVSLLPAKGWGIAELALRYEKDGIPLLVEKKFDYADGDDSPLPVKTMETKTVSRPESDRSETLREERVRYLECDGVRAAQKEFSLKYYGLKRPDLRTPHEKRLGRSLMALGGAVLLFGLARQYKILRRRQGAKRRSRRRFRRREDGAAGPGREETPRV